MSSDSGISGPSPTYVYKRKPISHFLKKFENIIDNEPDLGFVGRGPTAPG
jgi:hypothetical protein